MYASVGSEVPGDGWTFEPKYDGIRVLAYMTSQGVKLITRNGKDKAQQFPEIVAALKKLASQGKTVAGAYCVRARSGAPVSTPLEWAELTEGLDPRDFTIANAPDHFAKVGDIWGETMKKKNSLRALV